MCSEGNSKPRVYPKVRFPEKLIDIFPKMSKNLGKQSGHFGLEDNFNEDAAREFPSEWFQRMFIGMAIGALYIKIKMIKMIKIYIYILYIYIQIYLYKKQWTMYLKVCLGYVISLCTPHS